MRIQICTVTALMLASCSALAPSSTQEPGLRERNRRVSVYLGQRSLDDRDYAPLEDQPTVGVEYSDELPDSPVGWELGVMVSRDDQDDFFGTDIAASTSELYGGARVTFGQPDAPVRSYFGAGASVINSEFEVGPFNEDDSSLAAYAHTGVIWDLTAAFFVGFDLRLLFLSDLTIAGFDTDADYVQAAFVLGTSF